MIDIDTREIVDLIDSRNCEDVSKWLKTFPNLKIISRDGSIEYKKSITTAHPNAAQISDRFHLLKNLTGYLKDAIKRRFKTKIELEENKNIDKLNLEAKEKHKFETKWDLILKVKELKAKNYTIDSICKALA